MAMLKLRSSDKEEFLITEEAAKRSKVIGGMLDEGVVRPEGSETQVVDVNDVDGTTLALVVEFLKKHEDLSAGKTTAKEIKDWEDGFIKVSDKQLYHLITAGNYLDIDALNDLTLRTVADMIREAKTPEGIRARFGIKNDFSPEDYAIVTKEGMWAFPDTAE